MNDNILVLAHKACLDGAAAAWCFWRRFPNAEIHFVQYGDPVPVDVTDRVVVVADFCFDLETTKELIKKARAYTMLDHHPLAEKVVDGIRAWVTSVDFDIEASFHDVKGVESSVDCGAVDGYWGHLFVQYNKNESGAMQAWKFCFPDQEPADFIKYHDDYDRWKFKIPETDPYMAGMGRYPLNLVTFKTIFNGAFDGPLPTLNSQSSDVVALGKPLVEYRNALVGNIIKDTKHYLKVRDHNGMVHTVPVANGPKQLISYISHALSYGDKDAPFSLVYYDTNKGRVYRFGSREEDGMNVTPVAEFWGGGGHANASGTVHNKRQNLFTPWQGFKQRAKRFLKLDMRK
ncbi:MAG TPA: hypothetical protein VN081_05135 [Dongiaceae bacterium]|nr:hypothetical protein [Dongiaceae bacterium]